MERSTAITEETRRRMYQKLEKPMGSEDASILMEHLPSAGWADIATKRDLGHLHLQVQLALSESERRILARLHTSQLAILLAVVGALVGSAAWL